MELGGASLPPAGLSHGPGLDTVLAVALPGPLVLLSLSLTLDRAGLLGWTCSLVKEGGAEGGPLEATDRDSGDNG